MKKQIVALQILLVSFPSFGLHVFWNMVKKNMFPQKSELQLFNEAIDQTYRLEYSPLAHFLEKYPLWVLKINPYMISLYMNEVVEKKDHDNIVRFVNAGFSPDMTDFYGYPLLTRAVLNHATKTVKVLLQCGADPEKCDKNGFPPLYYACVLKKKEMIRLLTNAGASLGRYAFNKLLAAGTHNDIISYIWKLVGEDPVLAASEGSLCINNPSISIDFTVCYSRFQTGKITPLGALLKNKHTDMALILFQSFIDEIEKNKNNKRAAIAALAVLKHPLHNDRTKAILGKALIFDSNGCMRDLFVQRILHKL